MTQAPRVGLTIDRENPWPGLFPYFEDAAEFFNGRDQETAELLRLVRRDVLCLLYGQSGLGKSSLIQAGLFPRLREESFLPVYVRLDFTSPLAIRDQLWRTFTAALDKQGIDARRPREGEGLWAYFNDAALEFWDARNRPLMPVVVLDQFEEIFTSGSALAAHLAEGGFLAELAELIDRRVPAHVRAELEADPAAPARYHFGAARFRVLLGFREDFLPEFEELFRALRLPSGGRLRLTRMRHSQALDAVRRTGGDLVDAEVASEIVDFVSGRSRAGQTVEIEPALLSVVCYELNNRRRQKGEARISSALLSGAREQIIDEFYHRSLAHVAPEVREFIEEELLTESGYRDSSAIEDAVKRPGVTEAAIRDLVEKRVLRLEERFGILRVELTHDLLTSVVLRDRNERQERRRLEAEREREAARLRRTRRLLRLGMATATGAAILVVVFAVLLQRAQEEKARAIQAQASLFLARATAALENNVPKEPYVSLARALALDPGNSGAAARSISLLTQRRYPNLEVALPWDSASAQSFVGAIDADTLLLRADSVALLLRMPRAGEKANAFAVSCVRTTLESADTAVVSKLPASPSWVIATSGFAERSRYQVDATAWDEIRKAARRECVPAVKKGDAPYARLLGLDATAALYATRDSTLLVAALDGSKPRSLSIAADLEGLSRAWIDGERRHVVAARHSGEAWLVPADGGTPAQALPASGAEGDPQVVRANFAPGGGSLFVSRRGGDGELWSVTPLRRLARLRIEFPEAATFSPDGRWLAAIRGGLVEFLDTSDGTVKGKVQARLAFNHVAFSPDSRRAAISSQSGNVYVDKVPEGTREVTFGHEGAAVEAHFIDSRHVVTAAFDAAVRVFSTAGEGGTLVSEPLLHRGPVIFARPVAVAGSDSVRVVSLADDQVLRVWRAHLEPPPEIRAPTEASPALDFSRDGSTFARIDRGGLVRVSAIDPALRDSGSAGMTTIAAAEGASGVRRIRLSEDGGMVAWALDDGTIGWRSTRGGEVFVVPRVKLPAQASDLAFSRDARLLAARLNDQAIRVFDVSAGRPTGLPIDAADGAVAWGFSGNGDTILIALPQRLEAYDARTGYSLAATATSGIVSADVNPTVAEIAHSRGREVAVWAPGSAAAPRRRSMPTFVSAVRFSSDGAKLLTLSVDGNVRVLDAATLADEGVPLRHSFAVVRAEFAPDGRWVVTKALDGIVRVWDHTAGQVIATAAQPPDAADARALLLGRDNWLALVGPDGSVEWSPVAVGYPRPLPEWFGAIFAALSGLAAIDEGQSAAQTTGSPKRSPEWESWWKAWAAYVANRRSNPGES